MSALETRAHVVGREHFYLSPLPLTGTTAKKMADGITEGVDKLKWYDSSDKARRGFCPECGSSIFKDNKDGEKIVLSVGALDSPTDLKFLKNIFEDSKGDYYTLPGA